MIMNTDPEWLKNKTEAEDNCDVSVGDLLYPECPRCGESIAEPVTLRSKEFQGDEMHGGIIEHEEEACGLCVKEDKLRACEQFTEAEIWKIMTEYRLELIARVVGAEQPVESDEP